jgi:sodium transport system permease protein
MKALMAVMRKELRDLMRDRRTLYIALLMGPLLLPAIMIGLGGLASKKISSQLEKTLEVPILGVEHAPNLVAWLEGQNLRAEPAPSDPEAAIRRQDEDVILRIAPDYGEDWRAGRPALVEILHDASREDSRIPVSRVMGLLQAYGDSAGALRLLARGVSPTVGKPLRVAQTDLSTPEGRQGQAMAFLPYLLILSAFLGAGALMVIDATAGERERQSLEPLLATPAARESIMSGKIAAACLVGLVSLLLTLIAFKIGFQLAPGLGGKADVSLAAIAQLLLVLAPTVLLGTTVLTLISASAKSVKEAQSYMTILMLLPMIPTLVLMVNPVKNQLWMLAVPFLSQNQMIMKVLRGETTTAGEWAFYLAVGFGLGVVLWLLAARLYHREKLAISA